MKKRVGIAILFVIAIGIGLGIYCYNKGCFSHNNDHLLVLYGNVDVRQVDISFRVAGQVEELYFEEGDLVHRGDCIAKLNITPFISQVKEAEAKLESIKTNQSNAKILLDRRSELIGDGGVSQENLDDATAKYAGLVADYAAASAALEVARDNLSYTHIFAPNEGILLTRIREPGSVVNLSEPVCTLSLSTPVWIRAFVSEPDLGKIYYGMKAEIYTDTKGVSCAIGKIGFISPVAEFTPKTVQTTELRTDLVYRLRIYVEQPNRVLKQGMPVTVKLDTSWVKSE